MHASATHPSPLRASSRRAPGVAAVVILLAASFFATGCRREGDPEPEPTLPAPVARWLAAAYHEADGSPRQRLQRWSGELALSASGSVGADDRSLLHGAARRLAVAAPRLRPRLEYQPTSFVVHYLSPVPVSGPERGPDPRVETDCPPDAAGRILRAEVRVPTGDWIPQALRDDLTLEGLLTCLGLPGRLPRGTPGAEYESVLAAEPNWGDVRLTDDDLLTLSVHFDPALTPGLTAPDALAALGLPATAVVR